MTKKNSNLSEAKKAKNDEFYTQYRDIEKEMEAYLDYNQNLFRGKIVLLPCDDPEWSNFTKYFVSNFKQLGIKKLISTSFAHNSKGVSWDYEPTQAEQSSPNYNAEKSKTNGKIFILNADTNHDEITDFNDIEWQYLQGDGDFRSEEVTKIRDEVDIIVTNPPFSLFREFLAWIVEANKQFSIIGNMNAITYKDVFPLIQSNDLWLGVTISSGDREFRVPDSYPLEAASTRIDNEGNRYIRVKGVRWFTNIEHGRRHEPLQLMTMAENQKFNADIIQKNPNFYQNYDNYNAIEVAKTAMIPSDYMGVMGVPISFLDKYCPEQFEILGIDNDIKEGLLDYLKIKGWQGKIDRPYIDNKRLYSRILIKHKTQPQPQKENSHAN